MSSAQSQTSPQNSRSLRFKKQKTFLQLPLQHPPDQQPPRIKSVQNCSTKKFVFPSPERCLQILQTQRRLSFLQEQKKALLTELRKMRQGALSAIMEKEQAIERLHEKIQEAKYEVEDKEKDEYFASVRLQEAQCELERLEREREELRLEHIEAIISKDRVLDELAEELQKVKNSVTTLELQDRALTQKLTRIQMQNMQLHDELLLSRTSLVQLRNSLYTSQSVAFSCSLGRSIISSPLLKPKQDRSQRKLSGSSSDLSAVVRLQEMNAEMREMHQKELQHLRRYYDGLLEEIAMGFGMAGAGRGFTLQTEENVETEGNFRTEESLRTEGNQNQKMTKSDLKNQIRLLEKNGSQSIIENPEKRLPTNPDQTQSQFSLKHFQYDTREKQKQLRRLVQQIIKQSAQEKFTIPKLQINRMNGSTGSRTSRTSRSRQEINKMNGSRARIRKDRAGQQSIPRYVKLGGAFAVSVGLIYVLFLRNRRV